MTRHAGASGDVKTVWDDKYISLLSWGRETSYLRDILTFCVKDMADSASLKVGAKRRVLDGLMDR